MLALLSIMSLSPGDLEKLIATAVEAAIKGMRNGNGKSKRAIKEVAFRRVNELDGRDQEWRDFSFGFKVALKRTSPEAHKVVEWIEKQTKETGAMEADLEFEEIAVNALSGELYDIICMLAKGEAAMLVRGVDDLDGFKAWSRMVWRYSPTTPARLLTAMLAVMNSTQAKTTKEVTGLIEQGNLLRLHWRGISRRH